MTKLILFLCIVAGALRQCQRGHMLDGGEWERRRGPVTQSVRHPRPASGRRISHPRHPWSVLTLR